MKIGILQCDSVIGKFRRRFGDYPGMFQNLFKAVDSTTHFLVYDVRQGIYPGDINECDGYMITGSKESVYQLQSWIQRLQSFVIELHESRKKLIGICFGHQLIAQALGGKTEAAHQGWGIGVMANEVFANCPWMTPALNAFNLAVSHQDQVTTLPQNAILLAGNDFCPNSMYRIGSHILTFQGHPEFSKGYIRALMHYRKELIGVGGLEQGLLSLRQPTHETSVTRWILNFIGYVERSQPTG